MPGIEAAFCLYKDGEQNRKGTTCFGGTYPRQVLMTELIHDKHIRFINDQLPPLLRVPNELFLLIRQCKMTRRQEYDAWEPLL